MHPLLQHNFHTPDSLNFLSVYVDVYQKKNNI